MTMIRFGWTAFLFFSGYVSFCASLPFTAKSNVRELTATQLPAALKTHKPVFLLLYAPWCGHCKALHPEYEALGKKTKGVVEVLAVDADKYRGVGQEYHVKGFPTLIYYGTRKGPKDWKPYEGARNASSMLSAALGLVDSTQARMVSSSKLLEKAFQARPTTKYVAALFTEKEKAPPLMQVLAYDPILVDTVAVAVVRKSSELVKTFSPASFPAVAILVKVDGVIKVQSWYENEISYNGLLTYIAKEIGITIPLSSSESSKGNKKEKKKSENNDTSSKKVEKETVAKPAFPVRPIEFSVQHMNLFCRSNAPTKQDQQPYCVIVLYDSEHAEEFYPVCEMIVKQFRNDPFVVMYGHNEEDIRKLGLMETSQDAPALIVFREGSRGVRQYTHSFSSADEFEVEGVKILERIAGGELTLKRTSQHLPEEF